MTAARDVPSGDAPRPGGQDDLKERFREALARKNARHAESSGGDDGKEQSKVHGAHGPAHLQRSFRRKSG